VEERVEALAHARLQGGNIQPLLRFGMDKLSAGGMDILVWHVLLKHYCPRTIQDTSGREISNVRQDAPMYVQTAPSTFSRVPSSHTLHPT
jgi:hypothetical protein